MRGQGHLGKTKLSFSEPKSRLLEPIERDKVVTCVCGACDPLTQCNFQRFPELVFQLSLGYRTWLAS